jgi:hypothetical protein
VTLGYCDLGYCDLGYYASVTAHAGPTLLTTPFGTLRQWTSTTARLNKALPGVCD